MRRRIVNVLRKEWAVMASSFSNLLYVALIPLLLTGQALLLVWLVSRFVGGQVMTTSMLEAAPAAGMLSSLSSADQFRVLLLSQFNFFLLIVPAMIANVFATLSIVEEKLTRTLEPLLATPVRTWELLVGKALSGAIPAFVVTWACAGIFLLSAVGLGWKHLLRFVLTSTWYLSLFLLTPAVAVMSFVLGVIGSSRASDPKSAQNIAIVIVLPIFALIGVQVTGLVWFTPTLTLILSLGIAGIDAILVWLAVRLFKRESIVVRWR